jgi:hypothetical protein
MLDLWDANWSGRQTDRASHNPPAASSAAIARNRCFAFIVFCFLIQASHSLSPRHYARFPGVGFQFGTKAGNSGAKRPRAGMNLIPAESVARLRSRLGHGQNPSPRPPANFKTGSKQVLEIFREMEISGSTGIPVFAGFRESGAWWDSSFRSSAQPGSRP